MLFNLAARLLLRDFLRIDSHQKPARQPEASFPAIEIADGVLVFENRAHDFPQRVIYRRGADGRLDARIEGTIDGQPRAVDFPYRRVACPG